MGDEVCGLTCICISAAMSRYALFGSGESVCMFRLGLFHLQCRVTVKDDIGAPLDRFKIYQMDGSLVSIPRLSHIHNLVLKNSKSRVHACNNSGATRRQHRYGLSNIVRTHLKNIILQKFRKNRENGRICRADCPIIMVTTRLIENSCIRV